QAQASHRFFRHNQALGSLLGPLRPSPQEASSWQITRRDVLDACAATSATSSTIAPAPRPSSRMASWPSGSARWKRTARRPA
ncbi:MAG: twin-arginine translocation signal domain-containing protein, partial [Candidatus Sericytochromatia bacterium]|nr:twin-arginine translocation signal domain-containing protein [Candidatus Tanganyikabacteria bacterium]